MVLIVQIIHKDWVVKPKTKYQLFAACKKLTSSTNMPKTKVTRQKEIFRLNRSCYYNYKAKMNLSQIFKKTKNSTIRA